MKTADFLGLYFCFLLFQKKKKEKNNLNEFTLKDTEAALGTAPYINSTLF